MRQIQFGAGSWLVALALAACSGGEFSAGDGRGAVATAEAGKATAEQPSSENDGSHGGSRSLSVGGNGKAGSAGGGAGGATNAGGANAAAGTSSNAAGAMAAPPAAGGGASSCESGSVTIRMRPGADLPRDYLCDASCGTGWLTITDSQGATAFSISAACGAATCDTCEVQACGAAACLPTALGASGAELVWHGTYLAQDTCGNSMACQREACVTPGRYKARACVALNQGQAEYGCMPREEQLCAEVEFEFPSKEAVVLVLEK